MTMVKLDGRRFGRLVVECEAGRSKTRDALWLCLCDCGTRKTVRSKSLLSKTRPQRSCGCYRSPKKQIVYPDRIGVRFGRLVVTGQQPRAKGARLKFTLHCDCGNDHCSTWGNLISGRVLSCGCIRPKITLPNGQTGSIAALALSADLSMNAIAWRRKRLGMSIVESLTVPKYDPGRRLLNLGDERGTLKQFASQYGLRTETVRARMSQGMSLFDALTTPRKTYSTKARSRPSGNIDGRTEDRFEGDEILRLLGKSV